MTLSKEDAALALDEIGAARARMATLKGYSEAAVHLIIWGLVWMVANTVTDLAPPYGGTAWLACIAVGTLASALKGGTRLRKASQGLGTRVVARPQTWRFGHNFLVIFGFFAALFFVIGPISGRQGNALISLFWCFAYMLTGVWTGWRIFAIGAVTAAATLFGFVALKEHFSLWMGLVGGGSLILGGLWLRRV